MNRYKKEVYSDMQMKRPPSKTCIFCDKTIDAIGGKRIIAQELRGITLSKMKTGGGNKDFPHQSLLLFTDPNVYMDYWGKKTIWSKAAIDSAKTAFLNGKRPWFCQICGDRKCTKCGSPVSYPMGSDILYSDGSTSHLGIFPIDPGCINTDCDKNKKGRIKSRRGINKEK